VRINLSDKPTNGAAVPEEDEDEDFITPQTQLRKTFDAVSEQIERLMKRGREADGVARDMMFELGGTILPLLRDAVGHVGGAIEWIDARLDTVESDEALDSMLLWEDADRIEKVLSQHARILEELIPETTEGTEQHEALGILQRETESLREWVKEVTVTEPDDAADEEESTADEPAGTVADA